MAEQKMEKQKGSFWSSKTINQRIRDIIEEFVPPPREPYAEDAAYELHLGAEAYVSGEKEKTRLDRDQIVAIAPGQIALLLTEEKLRMPTNVIGFISLKTSVKVPGLINVSGFHVDPGFEGRLVF